MGRFGIKGVLLVALLTVGACAPIYRDHGYVPPEDELDQLVVGIDTRATVEDTVGPPSSEALVSDNSYFYVRTRLRAIAFQAPQEIERDVVAITFDDTDVIENIEQFTLEDGVVVRINRRVTETSIRDQTFLRQLLRNLGRFSPAAVLDQ